MNYFSPKKMFTKRDFGSDLLIARTSTNSHLAFQNYCKDFLKAHSEKQGYFYG